MMGSSPARNGQATKGKLKKTFTGPIKPMVDKDGDGIPIGVDIKDTPGGKQSTKKEFKNMRKTESKPKAKKSGPKPVDPRKRPFDDGRNKGTLKSNTQFKSDINKVKSGDGIEFLKTIVKNKAIKAYDYFTKK